MDPMKPTLSLFAALLAVTALGAQVQQVTQEIRVAPASAPAVAIAGGGAPMAVGSGVVFGQVTEADSNRPVPGAIVSIVLSGAQIRVMTDSQGRFGFRDLPAGGFRISTTRPGWVDGAYGRTRPSGPTLPLALADGERVSGVSIPMWRYAAIAGTIIDASGDPLINLPVRVMRKAMYGGKPRLTVVAQDQTDDRGQYRVSNLEPGEYVVVVPMQTPSGPPIMLNGDMVAGVHAPLKITAGSDSSTRTVAGTGAGTVGGGGVLPPPVGGVVGVGGGVLGGPLVEMVVLPPLLPSPPSPPPPQETSMAASSRTLADPRQRFMVDLSVRIVSQCGTQTCRARAGWMIWNGRGSLIRAGEQSGRLARGNIYGS